MYIVGKFFFFFFLISKKDVYFLPTYINLSYLSKIIIIIINLPTYIHLSYLSKKKKKTYIGDISTSIFQPKQGLAL